MRIDIIEDESIAEDSITIRCKEVTPEIRMWIEDIQNKKITAYHRGQKVVVILKEVLFFETDQDAVFVHTAKNSYKTDYRLYELEDMLPGYFVRISKSTICNINRIESLERKLTSTRAIQFSESHKVSYVSRMYYPVLKEKLAERSTL